MKKTKISIVFILLLISCSNKKEDVKKNINPETISVNDRQKDLGSISKYIKNLDYLELKGVEDFDIIAGIDKIEIYNDLIYVLDRKKSNLLVFDKNGNFKNKIGKRGNGPGEYKIISDFAINRSLNKIYILSSQDISVFTFNLDQNNTFDKKLKFDSFFPKRISLINDEHIVLFTSNSNDSYHDLVFVDTNGEIIKEDFKYPNDIADIAFRFTGGVNDFDNKNFYTITSSPNLYRINEDLSHDLVYKFDLGYNSWKHEDRYNLGKFDEELGKLEMAYLNNSFFETENFLTYKYTDKTYINLGFFDKKSKRNYDKNSFDNDGNIFLFYNIVGVSNNKFISSYSPENFKPTIERFKNFEKELANISPNLLNNLSTYDPLTDTNHFLILFNFEADQ